MSPLEVDLAGRILATIFSLLCLITGSVMLDRAFDGKIARIVFGVLAMVVGLLFAACAVFL